MEPLKNIYTHAGVFREIARGMKAVYPPLKEKDFYEALVDGLDSLELKARIARAADVCRRFLPPAYPDALAVLYRFVEGKDNRLVYLFLPAFVAKYGREHYQKSLEAMRDFTQYSSSEEGIRAFIEMNPEKTLAAMKAWTASSSVHIRRLASEGCRPRLPWAKKIPILIEDPEWTWSILEKLKEDSEKYVQKSVANHINDISRDHADWLVARLKQWNLSHPSTGWIVRHGLRTLIKQGHKGALKLMGSGAKPRIVLKGARWDRKVKIGGACALRVEVVSSAERPQPLIIDYRIFFCKKGGLQKPKTFKLKSCTLAPGESLTLNARYAFKDMTTRKHYAGGHAWQLLVNGEALEMYSFEVC